jgi:hypothetical protein
MAWTSPRFGSRESFDMTESGMFDTTAGSCSTSRNSDASATSADMSACGSVATRRTLAHADRSNITPESPANGPNRNQQYRIETPLHPAYRSPHESRSEDQTTDESGRASSSRNSVRWAFLSFVVQRGQNAPIAAEGRAGSAGCVPHRARAFVADLGRATPSICSSLSFRQGQGTTRVCHDLGFHNQQIIIRDCASRGD